MLMSSLHPELPPLAENLARHLGAEGEKAEVVTVIHQSGETAQTLLDRARHAYDGGIKAVLLAFSDRDLQTADADREAAPWSFEEAEAALTAADLSVAHGELSLDSDAGFSRHTALFVLAPDPAVRQQVSALLRTGSASFTVRGDIGETAQNSSDAPRQVCIVTSELHGPMRNGGIGTSYTALAESLAADGQDVTILFVGDRTTDEPMSHWVDYYRREKNLRLEALKFEDDRRLPWQQNWIRRSHAACEWLRQRPEPFDIIHYPECNGHGFHIALAKHQGRAFRNTTLCVGAHSSTRWIHESAGSGFSSTAHLAQDFMEEMSIRWADVCVSPSAYLTHWMRHQGWALPERTIAQQNIQPQNTRGADERSDQPLPTTTDVRELVFFGRLEARKGLPTFCDALDLLATETAAADLKITFMGKETMIGGLGSRQILETRAEAGNWPFDWQILSDRDQAGANAYLQGDGRVAIMPSPVDNSPNTVLECIGLKIPFLATRAGGIPELIDPRDVAQCTFYHPEMAGRPEGIRRAVLRILESGIRPARRAVSAPANEESWLAWHRSLSQTKAEPVGPSTDDSVKSLSLRDWRAVPDCGSDFVLFTDPATVLHDDAASRLVAAANTSGADLLCSYHDEFVGEQPPATAGERFSYPVGGAIMLAPFWNCFGAGPFLLRRSAWDRIKDLPLPTNGSLEDLREFFTRSIQAGLEVEVVAEPLSWRRIDSERAEGDGAEPDPDPNIVRLLTSGADPALRQLLGFFMSKQQQSDEMIQEYYDLRYRVKEGYDQLAEKFHAQSAWLKEREGVLAERERELERAQSQAKDAKTALRAQKDQSKTEIRDLKKKIEEAEKRNQKGFGSKLGRIFGKGEA